MRTAITRIVQTVIGVVTIVMLLEVWGVHIVHFFTSGGVGNKIASALVTIAIAAVFTVIVWERANVLVEQRLEEWNASGDRVRAARLRTLLPMMRTSLFIVIAMVVVLTGLSEFGVNTAPLLASASIFGVALGFGSQKLVQDFITGIFLLMENAMQVGDWVTVSGVSGTVEYLSIRTVRLRGGDGSLYTVPFSSVTTVNNTNRGIGNAAVRVQIALGQDVDLAISTLKEIGAPCVRTKRFATAFCRTSVSGASMPSMARPSRSPARSNAATARDGRRNANSTGAFSTSSRRAVSRLRIRSTIL